jgi:hypothetical protein
MVRQCRKLTAAGVLLSAAFSLSASAEPKTEAAKAGKATPPPQATAAGLDKQEKVKSDKPQVSAEKAEGKADKAEAKADKAVAKADKAEAKADKAEAKAEAKADKAEAKAEARAERAENEADVKHPAVGHEGHGEGGAHHHGRGKFKSAVSELREKYKSGSLKKDELDKELRALKESRKERRAEHQRAIKERWGNSLAAPAARQELAHHERTMAKLNRLLLLAEAERKGKAKDKLVERIEKLIAHENERHERKMSQLDATPRAQGALNAPASTSATMKASAEMPAGQAVKTGGEK